jgi:hypothetical protein
MENFFELLLQPLRNIWAGLVGFIPNILAMLIIIGVGLLIAWMVKAALSKVFSTLKMDAWCDRVGLTAMVRKANVWSKPSKLFVETVYWFLAVLFVMVGLTALRLQAIDSLTMQFFMYLPRAFSALLILVIGYILTGFVSRAVLIAAVNSGYHYAKLLAEAVRMLLAVLMLAMALEQLQVAPGIVIAAFSIIFGGIVIALAIAFGAGGIDAARKIIEKSSEEKKESGQDIEHL